MFCCTSCRIVLNGLSARPARLAPCRLAARTRLRAMVCCLHTCTTCDHVCVCVFCVGVSLCVLFVFFVLLFCARALCSTVSISGVRSVAPAAEASWGVYIIIIIIIVIIIMYLSIHVYIYIYMYTYTSTYTYTYTYIYIYR